MARLAENQKEIAQLRSQLQEKQVPDIYSEQVTILQAELKQQDSYFTKQEKVYLDQIEQLSDEVKRLRQDNYSNSDQVDQMVKMAAEMKRNNQALIKDNQKLQAQIHATEKQLLVAEQQLHILNKKVPFMPQQNQTQRSDYQSQDNFKSLPEIMTRRSSVNGLETQLNNIKRPSSRISDGIQSQPVLSDPNPISNPYDGVRPMNYKRPTVMFKSLLTKPTSAVRS